MMVVWKKSFIFTLMQYIYIKVACLFEFLAPASCFISSCRSESLWFPNRMCCGWSGGMTQRWQVFHSKTLVCLSRGMVRAAWSMITISWRFDSCCRNKTSTNALSNGISNYCSTLRFVDFPFLPAHQLHPSWLWFPASVPRKIICEETQEKTVVAENI